MNIKTNIAALNASSNLEKYSNKAQDSLEKISSGTKLGSVTSDPALSSLSASLKSKISLQSQALQNITNGVAMATVAINALDEQKQILDNVKEILFDAANTAMHSENELRSMYQDIVSKLKRFNQIAADTTYDGVHLLQKDGTLAEATATKGEAANLFNIQTGASADDVVKSRDPIASNLFLIDELFAADNPVVITAKYNFDEFMNGGNSENLFSNKTAAGSTYNPEHIIATVEEAAKKLAKFKNEASNVLSSLEEKFNSIKISISQLKTANSNIESVDFAQESANFNKYSVLSKAGTFVLAQANKLDEQILYLLR